MKFRTVLGALAMMSVAALLCARADDKATSVSAHALTPSRSWPASGSSSAKMESRPTRSRPRSA